MKNPLVKESEYHPGVYRTLTASDVRRIFGIGPNATLPAEEVRGTYRGPRGVVSLRIAPRTDPQVNQRILRPHRVFAICSFCLKEIPFGRMHQHLRRKDHQ